jgi:hypothetical protein
MHISERMLMGIPAAETEIDTTDKCSVEVDDDKLFVVCPVEGHVGGIFEDIVIGMAHYHNVSVTLGTFGAEALESMLGVRRVAG